MPVTDPIADLLTRIRNAQRARESSCRCPWSRIKEGICTLLVREGYLASCRTEGEGKGKHLLITFAGDRPPLALTRVSKPGRRVYAPVKEIRPVLQGMGVAIVTTSQGLLTNREAREKGVGGEVLCTVS